MRHYLQQIKKLPTNASMESSDIITSSLTSEPDDLTFIHAQSGLPTTHETRRTPDGFLIEPSRLPNCVPLPASKKSLGSWVWQHGHAIGVLDKYQVVHRHWLCNTCYSDSTKHPLPTYLLPAMKNTTKAMDHLQRHGYDRAGNKHNISNKKRKHLDLSAWDRQ